MDASSTFGLQEGLVFAKESGINPIILKGDARNVYEDLDNSEINLSHNGNILFDVYALAA